MPTDISQPSTDMYNSSRPSLLQWGSAPPPEEICHCVPVTGSGSTNTCGPPELSTAYAMNFESGENWACIELADVVGPDLDVRSRRDVVDPESAARDRDGNQTTIERPVLDQLVVRRIEDQPLITRSVRRLFVDVVVRTALRREQDPLAISRPGRPHVGAIVGQPRRAAMGDVVDPDVRVGRLAAPIARRPRVPCPVRTAAV